MGTKRTKTQQFLSSKDIPIAYEAERALLGCCITNNIPLTISDDYFYSDKHKDIAKAIRALAAEGITVDHASVAEYIMSRPQNKRTATIQDLVEIMEYAGSIDNYDFYAEHIRSAAIARQLLQQCYAVIQSSPTLRDPNKLKSKAALLAKCIENLNGNSNGARKHGTAHISDVLPHILKSVEKREELSAHYIKTGLTDVDKITGGLARTDLIIVAARPGMGKTAFALSIARRVAERGHRVMFFSLEMSKEQIVQRLIAQKARVDLKGLRQGLLTENGLVNVMKTGADIAELPIFIDDTPALSDVEIRFRAIPKRPDLVVIDYLQLCKATGKNDRREQEVASITRSLKGLAKDLNCPVILLSQLNREVEKRNVKIPLLSDLRESGAIEQDADVIIFLYRAGYYGKKEENGVARVIVAKQRNGPTGTVKVGFWEHCTEFYSIDKEYI